MATQTSKKKGETSTTVSVGIRIDPKIKFSLDILGRMQKRSLTAVIEWAISAAIEREYLDQHTTMSDVLDQIWSTDESTRFISLCFKLPIALTYDELRIWETIKASQYFWNTYQDGTYDTTIDNICLASVRDGWSSLLIHVEKHKTSSTVIPLRDSDIILF